MSNTPENSEYPAIVADGFGYVHTFWAEDVGGAAFQADEPPQQGNSILYSRWDGASWTAPTDVLYVPGDAAVGFAAVAVDAENWLHIVWTGMTNIYYSKAPSWDAQSPISWSKPMVIATDSARSRWDSDIAVDPTGSLHVVYATGGDAVGVYHISSQDRGTTWGPATRLSLPFHPLEESFSHTQIVIDQSGRLHAVWQTNQREGYGQAIYYAQSSDAGQNWSQPEEFAYRDAGDFESSYPYLIAVPPDELHMLYIDGTIVGRYHRISRDGGETWSEPHHILTDMEGINGYVFPLLDAAGGLHLIANMRTKTQIGGIYHALWGGDGWMPVERLPLGDEGGGAHYTAGTMRLGNEIHLVWSQLARGEIGHIRGVVSSVPEATAMDIPAPQSPAVRTPEVTTEPAMPIMGSPPATEVLPATSSAPLSGSESSANPLLIAALLTFVLLGATVTWKQVRNR